MAPEDKKQFALKQSIPGLLVNEGSKLEELDLKAYLENPVDEPIQFSAELAGGGALPLGIKFTDNGILSGIPGVGTAKEIPYEIKIVAVSPLVSPLIINVKLTIKKRVAAEDFIDYWKKIAEGLELPDLKALLTREVTPIDVYHLLERFATLIMWNADDLTPADEGKLIQLKDASSKYNVFDFKSALVASPKDLYDTERSLKDAVQTAKAMIHEIHNRKWNVELAGFDKMVTAAWVEAQMLNLKGAGHKIEVRNFEPSEPDREIYEIIMALQGNTLTR